MDPTTRADGPRATHRTRRRAAAVAISGLALTALFTAACGSDDGDAAETTTTEHADHAAQGDGGSAAPLLGAEMDPTACDSFIELSAAMTGDPSTAGPAIEGMEAALPESLAPYGATVAAAFEAALGGDEAAMGSPEFVTAYEQIGTAMFNGCPAAERVDVAGVDYGFDGLPETLPAGTVAVRFTNKSSSSEMHEMIVLRRADGDDTDLETIATTPPNVRSAHRRADPVPRPDRPGAGGARPGRQRSRQPVDLAAAVGQLQDRAEPPVQRPDEVAGGRPVPGDRAGP